MTFFSLFSIPEFCQGFSPTLSFARSYLLPTLVGWLFGCLVRVSTRKKEEFRLEKESAASLENSRRSIFDPGRGRGTNQTHPNGAADRFTAQRQNTPPRAGRKQLSALRASLVELLRAFAARMARERGVPAVGQLRNEPARNRKTAAGHGG